MVYENIVTVYFTTVLTTIIVAIFGLGTGPPL